HYKCLIVQWSCVKGWADFWRRQSLLSGPVRRPLFIDDVTVRGLVETGSALSQDRINICLPSVELRRILWIVLVELVERSHPSHREHEPAERLIRSQTSEEFDNFLGGGAMGHFAQRYLRRFVR